MIANYFKKIGYKRVIMNIVGNIIMGLGISIFKFSGLGNDPFSGMTMALAICTGLAYANFQVLFNLCLFIIELSFGREFIGIGTIVNAFFLGYFVTFFYFILTKLWTTPEGLLARILIVCVGVIITSFGLSLYQTSDAGVAPYDALSLITMKKLPKVSYFWHRITDDAISAMICYFAGGIVGLGTLVSAFGLGPFIHFFNKHCTEKLLKNMN